MRPVINIDFRDKSKIDNVKKCLVTICHWICFSNVCFFALCVWGYSKPNFMNKDFHKAMEYRPGYINGKTYDKNKAIKNPNILLAKNLYEKFILQDFQYSSEPRIPKIIHQVWLSGEVPQKYHLLQQSFIKLHPDWLYVIWSAKDIEKFGLINKDKFNAAKAIGTKADIVRYEILYRLGGVHVDLDVECLKPFDILHHCCDFYSCVEPESHFFIGNAVMGARPFHPIFRKCVENFAKCNPEVVKFWDIVYNTSVGFFTNCCFEAFEECKDRTVIFPATYFCPILSGEAKRPHEQIMNLICEESFAIHYWFGSWIDKNTFDSSTFSSEH